MYRDAYHDENGADQPDSYWRRRAVTLAAGLSLVGLVCFLAWASSGGGKAGEPGAGELAGFGHAASRCRSQRVGLAIGESQQDSAGPGKPGGVAVRGRPGAGRTLPS